ncbi:MAG: hypothetical protein ACK5L5_12305 [Bacteroidales bacterium]
MARECLYDCRYDLIDRLKLGDQRRISEKVGCSTGFVSRVLNGYCNANTDIGRNIIRVAERMAERNGTIL